jgi:hypothetical protein
MVTMGHEDLSQNNYFYLRRNLVNQAFLIGTLLGEFIFV